MKEKNPKSRVGACTGAILACLIGSGFASGQEVLQFLTAYGPVQSGLAGLLALAVLAAVSSRVLRDARRLGAENADVLLCRYAGPGLGAAVGWAMPLLMLAVYAVMLAGAGALLAERYGLPTAAGRWGMLAFSLGTVLLGRARLTNILGGIGPLLLVLLVAASGAAVLRNPAAIPLAGAAAAALPRAAPRWWISGLLYAGCNLLTLIPFLAGLAPMLHSDRESRWAGCFGAGSFGAAALVLNYGLMADLPQLAGCAVPTAAMAGQLAPWLADGFALVLLGGIYTTAVPLLWAACGKLAQNEKSAGYRLTACGLAAVAALAARLPFAALLHALYPALGCAGAFLAFAVLWPRRKA